MTEDSLERPFSRFLDGNEILSFALFKGRVWTSWGQEAISTEIFCCQPSWIVKVFLCRGAHVLSQRATEGLIVSAYLHEHLSTADVSICCGATAGCLACQCGYCSRWQLLLYHQVDGLVERGLLARSLLSEFLGSYTVDLCLMVLSSY